MVWVPLDLYLIQPSIYNYNVELKKTTFKHIFFQKIYIFAMLNI